MISMAPPRVEGLARPNPESLLVSDGALRRQLCVLVTDGYIGAYSNRVMDHSPSGARGGCPRHRYGLYLCSNLLQQPRGSARGPQGSGAAHSCAVLLSPEKCALQLRVRQLEVEGCFIGGHGAAGEGRGRAGQEHSLKHASALGCPI